jgi:hypothetical protein
MVGKKRKRKKHGEDATADPKRKQENRQGNIPADLRTHIESVSFCVGCILLDKITSM